MTESTIEHQHERNKDGKRAVLAGTTHFSILTRTDQLLPIITPFLDAPMLETKRYV